MKKDSPDRVHLIDELRGLAIFLMVVYHTFFDLVILFGVDIPAFYSSFVQALVFFFAGLFIFISGASCQFSRNNLKRGAICFGFGLVMTIGTAVFAPGELILFGILHLLGLCMMLFPLLSPLLKKNTAPVGNDRMLSALCPHISCAGGNAWPSRLFRSHSPRRL